MQGGKVCHAHGGRAPQVRMAARLRLAALVDPAIDLLSRQVRPSKGAKIPHALQQSAARDILDRNGLRSKDEIIITQQLASTKYTHLEEGELEVLVRILEKISMPVDQHDQPVIEIQALPPAGKD